ncbi:MAG: hypothetical protein JWM98_1520 [Thermoleophilia bacterium]|nr:hypothetical protein [Thermoleophilia bacterium]
MLGLVDDARRVAHWVVGAPVEAWRYATRSVPLYRSEVTVAADEDLLDVSTLPAHLAQDVQRAHHGSGPEFHRTYSARIVGSGEDAAAALRGLSRGFGDASPGGMTEVEEPDRVLRVGDEVSIHLAGPWDAPVRVVDTTPTSFRFVTLDGHMEAGEIQFHAHDAEDGAIEFTIESWARSATRAFAALYHPLGLGKAIQLHMWATVLERVAERCGGQIEDGIRVVTRRKEHVDG